MTAPDRNGGDSAREYDACGNCGTMLQGSWCHVCGQPAKSLVRPVGLVATDAADTLFGYDTRIWRTLPTLMLRPGRLTLDYLAGKRARQVAPFRLFFVATVLAFLVLQLLVTPSGAGGFSSGGNAFTDLQTVEAVESRRDEILTGLASVPGQDDADHTEATDRPGAASAREAVEQAANRRILEIKGEPPSADAPRSDQPGALYFGDAPWNPTDNPIALAIAPDWLNANLNRWAERAKGNIGLVQQDPGRLVRAFFGLLPAVLFMLMPVFALLLKLLYVRRGQLYMQHLVVGLHSHAFICLAILLAALLGWTADRSESLAVVATPISWLSTITMAWIPLYLLLSQKRIYRQGWGRTVAKFLLLGSVYSMLIVLAITLTIMVSLVRL